MGPITCDAAPVALSPDQVKTGGLLCSTYGIFSYLNLRKTYV